MIHWSSLIADDKGDIDLDKLAHLAAIALAILGGLVVILGAILEMVFRVTLPADLVGTVVLALVIPLTGGKVAKAIVSRKAPPSNKDAAP